MFRVHDRKSLPVSGEDEGVNDNLPIIISIACDQYCFQLALRLDFNLEVRSMVKAAPIPPPGFDELSAEEKLDYVQSLWDRIAASPEEVPVPEWHKQIINQRLAAYRANPDAGKTWEQVRNELERKLAKKSSN